MTPINQQLDPAQLVIRRDQVVHANDLHLPSLIARPDREPSERHTDSLAVRPDESSTGS
jgi:hypothetical protein